MYEGSSCTQLLEASVQQPVMNLIWLHLHCDLLCMHTRSRRHSFKCIMALTLHYIVHFHASILPRTALADNCMPARGYNSFAVLASAHHTGPAALQGALGTFSIHKQLQLFAKLKAPDVAAVEDLEWVVLYYALRTGHCDKAIQVRHHCSAHAMTRHCS